jgi:hypothetical protein
MRVYTIAAFAMSPLADGTPDGGTYMEAFPCLIPAESIQDAAAQVRAVAMDRWKPDEGWYGHQAEILPVTKAFYDAAFEAARAGIIDLEEEAPLTFKFE